VTRKNPEIYVTIKHTCGHSCEWGFLLPIAKKLDPSVIHDFQKDMEPQKKEKCMWCTGQASPKIKVIWMGGFFVRKQQLVA